MSKTSAPITVLMPAYNAEKYIGEAIESILNQSFSDFELMIIDDGSSDSTMNIVDSFKDARIRVVTNEKNLGLIATLNKGLSLIKTEFVARMDADDISLPKRLETQLKFMRANPDVGVCGTWYDNILPDGSEKKGGRYLPSHNEILFKNLYQLHIIHGTTMMRMQVIRDNDLSFNPSFSHSEDYDFFARFAEVSKLHNIQESLYIIRHHEESVSKKFSDVQIGNSNRVKTRIFNQIGVSVVEHQLTSYLELMHQNYGAIGGEKRTGLLQLLTDLIEANETSSYLPSAYLRKEISVRVLHMFNNQSKTEKGLFSELNRFKHTSFSDNPKLFLTTYSKVLFA